jgi:hypothetical protein
MAWDLLTPSVEQCSIIKFPVKKKVKPAEVLCRLTAQYGEGILSCVSVCDWYNKFSEGCKEASNLLYCHVSPTDIWDVNIHSSEDLILGNRWITVHDIVCNSGISVRKCWNNNPWTLIVQEIVSLVSLTDVNVQIDSAACFYVYQTSAPEGNTILQQWPVTGCGCTISLQNQISPAWDGVTQDLHHQKNSRHSCEWARS